MPRENFLRLQYAIRCQELEPHSVVATYAKLSFHIACLASLRGRPGFWAGARRLITSAFLSALCYCRVVNWTVSGETGDHRLQTHLSICAALGGFPAACLLNTSECRGSCLPLHAGAAHRDYYVCSDGSAPLSVCPPRMSRHYLCTRSLSCLLTCFLRELP